MIIAKEVKIVKEVISCDVSPVVMFYSFQGQNTYLECSICAWLHLKPFSLPNLQTVQYIFLKVIKCLSSEHFFEMPEREKRLFWVLAQAEIKIHGIWVSTVIFSTAYRQREDIAVGLCPDTSDPPCVGQKADLAKIGTVAQRGGNLKKEDKNHFHYGETR